MKQKKIKDEVKNGKISRIRFNHKFSKNKKFANTKNNCFSKLGLDESETKKGWVTGLCFDKSVFSFRHITRKELFTVIDRLSENKAASPEFLLIYNSSAVCFKRLHIKIYFSEVPKKAYVTLIYKTCDPLEAENYRPTSVTPTPAKIIEKILLQQKLEHVENYEIINKNQYGFTKRKFSIDTVI